MFSAIRGADNSSPPGSIERIGPATPAEQEAGEIESQIPLRNDTSEDPHGESERRGFHPLMFFKIFFRSTSKLCMIVDLLWPAVPAAIAIRYSMPNNHLAIFITSYIAVIPLANTVGFAGKELARKLPRVARVIIETTFRSIVEIILLMILVTDRETEIVKAAILGSILSNLLLCLGACFIAGGLNQDEQTFHKVISEVGSGLMLVAGFGLVLPAIFGMASTSYFMSESGMLQRFSADAKMLSISRGTALVLLTNYLVFVYFNLSSRHSLMTEIYEADEEHDDDGQPDAAKERFTLTECAIALTISIACVSLVGIFLVRAIKHTLGNGHISDAFLGLILVPLITKAGQHLTDIDEALHNRANRAMAHILGSSIQTAFLNTPLVVLVSWCLNIRMDLHFGQFETLVFILAIVVVGNFLRDGKSNYLEGFLCVSAYVVIALAAWYSPGPAAKADWPQAVGYSPRLMLNNFL